MIIKNIIFQELNININTLNHFMKKKENGGNLAILKNKNIYINWIFIEDGRP